MTPGLGLKFLRDGVDSANLIAKYSLDGQEHWNFFGNEWSNHIPAPQRADLIPLELTYFTETDFIQAVGLSDMAGIYEDGSSPSELSFPFKLRFEPSQDLQWSTTYTEDVLDKLT